MLNQMIDASDDVLLRKTIFKSQLAKLPDPDPDPPTDPDPDDPEEDPVTPPPGGN